MRTIDLQQGTPEWLDFRRKHITATDASAIIGMNPWKSKLQIWEEKVLGWQQEFDQDSIDRMAEGTAMEPIARLAYQEITGHLVNPIVLESTEYPYLSASMDGMNGDLTHGVEIKCGASSHKSANKGVIPAYYEIQCQHQMLVTGLSYIDYFSYYKGEGILLKLRRDEELIKELIEKEIEFWHNVQAGTIPKD